RSLAKPHQLCGEVNRDAHNRAVRHHAEHWPNRPTVNAHCPKLVHRAFAHPAAARVLDTAESIRTMANTHGIQRIGKSCASDFKISLAGSCAGYGPPAVHVVVSICGC